VCPLRDDDTVLFGALDIDVYPLDPGGIRERCDAAGIPLILCRTKSGGIHGYVFFEEPVPARLVRDRLREWSRLIGYPDCEVFPAQDMMDEKATGNWLNMPMFAGEFTLRYAYRPDGSAMEISEFLEHAERSRVSREWLEAWRPTVKKVSEKPFANGEAAWFPEDGDWLEAPPCLVTLARTDRLKEQGSRNNAFFDIAVYLKKRIGDGFTSAAREYHRKYVPELPASEVNDTIRSVSRRKEYSYRCKQQPICAVCDRATCLTREFGVREELTQTWRVEFERVAKLMSDPPRWRVTANGQTVMLNDQELTIEWQFRARMKQLDLVLDPLKPEAFVEFIRGTFTGCEREEVPDGAKLAGQVRMHLATFCGTRAQAKEFDEILGGRPWTDGGRVYFVPTYFFEHLNARSVRTSRPELAAVMFDLGVQKHRRVIKGKDSEFWSVPAPSVQTEAFDVPELPKEEPF
jgi:hypothetical protein